MNLQNEGNNPPKPRKTQRMRSDFWAARRALQRFGDHVIDGRSRLAHALDAFRDELIADLGGEQAVSKQQRVLVDLAVRTHLMVQSLDAYIMHLPSMVNKRKRTLYPVVVQRAGLADSLARYMTQLGLEKRKPPEKDLREFLAERSTGTVAVPATEDVEIADACKPEEDHEREEERQS